MARTDVDARPADRRQRASRWAVAGIVAMVGVGLIAVGPALEPLSTPTPDDGEIDLPAGAEVGEQFTAPDVSDGGCEPAGCERWRASVGDGDTLVVGDRIVHHAGSELSIFDVASGDRIAYAETRSPPGDVPLQAVALGEEGRDTVVILGGPAGTEVRGLADGALRWEVEHGPGAMPSVVHEDVVLIADEDETGRRVRALQVADGEERFTVDNAWIGPDVVVQPTAGDEVRLIDAATGEVVLVVEPEEFHGVADGRVALMREDRLTVLTWPDLEELGRFPDDPDAPVDFVGGLVVDAQSPDDTPREVVDPGTGEVVAELAPGLPLSRSPDGDGVLVLEEQGSRVVVSHRDSSWSLQWRTELGFERSARTSLQIVVGPDGTFVVTTVRDDEIEQLFPFEARGGIPAFPPNLGPARDRSVAASMDGLRMVRSPDRTELRGDAGAVQFDGPVDLVHLADPLLVVVDGDLVAIDEGLVR